MSRVEERLTNDYFDITLIGSEGLAVSGRGNNAWNAYVAALNILNAKILFSKSMKVFYNMGNGVRQGLNYSEFSRLMVFEPPYEEQVAMADYLETKGTEVDAIIEQKKE